jgi:hypothetical protein
MEERLPGQGHDTSISDIFGSKDRTKEAGKKIRHCPTLQMIGDFFTKPLQGSLFRVFAMLS